MLTFRKEYVEAFRGTLTRNLGDVLYFSVKTHLCRAHMLNHVCTKAYQLCTQFTEEIKSSFRYSRTYLCCHSSEMCTTSTCNFGNSAEEMHLRKRRLRQFLPQSETKEGTKEFVSPSPGCDDRGDWQKICTLALPASSALLLLRRAGLGRGEEVCKNELPCAHA